MHTAAIKAKRASVLDLISKATYIRSEKFKKRSPPNMARGNQISNAVGTGPKAHSGGLNAPPPEGIEIQTKSEGPPLNFGVVKKIKVTQEGILY